MMTDLTVEENLRFSALSRLPPSWPLGRPSLLFLLVVGTSESAPRVSPAGVSLLAGKLQMVHDVMGLLGLSEIRDSVIGDARNRGISGGQRKRVNIVCRCR